MTQQNCVSSSLRTVQFLPPDILQLALEVRGPQGGHGADGAPALREHLAVVALRPQVDNLAEDLLGDLSVDAAPHPGDDLKGQDRGGPGNVAHGDLLAVGVVNQGLNQLPALGILGVVQHAVEEGSGLSFNSVASSIPFQALT